MACLYLEPPLVLTRLALLEPGDTTVRLLDLAAAPVPHVASAASAASPASICFGAELDSWRKACGIPRPSSVSRASVLGATVCGALQQSAGWTPSRLGIASASTTSATWCAVDFDSRGLSEGWHAVNPLLLPSTLPSALPTQIAMALGAQGCVLAFETGLLGVFHALEAAALSLLRGDADTMLVVAADECTDVQREAHQALHQQPPPAEFCGAMALERSNPNPNSHEREHKHEHDSDLTLRFISYSGDDTPLLPDGWHDAPRYLAQAPAFPPSMQNGTALRAIVEAALAHHPRALVIGQVPRLGCATIGLEWPAC